MILHPSNPSSPNFHQTQRKRQKIWGLITFLTGFPLNAPERQKVTIDQKIKIPIVL
jgi:hypothetical protein